MGDVNRLSLKERLYTIAIYRAYNSSVGILDRQCGEEQIWKSIANVSNKVGYIIQKRGRKWNDLVHLVHAEFIPSVDIIERLISIWLALQPAASMVSQ